MSRTIEVARHEAAHVVVGVALGLHLSEAVVEADNMAGYALFRVPKSKRLAWAITLAAGIAFERRSGDEYTARGDRELLRKLGHKRHAIESLVCAADAILESRATAHALVTRALMQRDITGSDVEAIATGDAIEGE